jgi:hypothetical protein
MVAPERAPVLVNLGVQDALRANNLSADFMSPTLTRNLAASLDRVPTGSLIMSVNAPGPFEVSLLCGLLKRYRFEWLESAHDTAVDRLVPLDYDFAIGSPVTQIDGKIFLRLNDGSTVPVKTRPTGSRPGSSNNSKCGSLVGGLSTQAHWRRRRQW